MTRQEQMYQLIDQQQASGQAIKVFCEQHQVKLCKEYLANLKWKDGFKCVKCEHTKSQIHKDYSRTCNLCSHTESPTANMLFHKVKFGVRKAFFICFEMATTTKSLSASYMSVHYGVTPRTVRLYLCTKFVRQ